MKSVLKFIFWAALLLALALLAFRVTAFLREREDRLIAAPSEGRMVQTASGSVYVEENGPEDGVPVLLVHGSVGWSRFWFETTDALASAGYRAISFDLSPMGYSEPDPDAEYGRIAQAERILSLISALEIRPILVAHSFGAGPATEALMRQQDQFRGYVIVAGAIGVGGDPNKSLPAPLEPVLVRELAVAATITNPLLFPTLLKQFLYRKDAASEHYLELLQQPYRVQSATRHIADWLPTLFEPPKNASSTNAENYAKVTLPVGLIWGDKDTATPLVQGQVLHSLMPQSKLVVMTDVGHIPQIEAPAEFQEHLLDLISPL